MDPNNPVTAKFYPGDYVAAASDIEQCGIVVDANIILDLLTIDNSPVQGIQSKCLKRIGEFKIGDFVVSNGNLGCINSVRVEVTIQLDDGTVHKVVNPQEGDLRAVEDLIVEAPLQYYPGQLVLSRFHWVWVYGKVSSVTVVPEIIDWIASVDKGTSIPESSSKQTKNLKLLSLYAHLSWEVGDWCLLPSSHETRETYDEMAAQVLIISNVHTIVDVCWQNGVVERGLDATSLTLVETAGERDFYPEQHVKRVGTRQYGIVKGINVHDRTACLKWFKPSYEEEVVSVYHLELHPDYKFYYGNLVAKRPDQTNSENHESFGYITNLKDGDVEVTWSDGRIYMVCPQAILRVYPPIDYDESDGRDGDDYMTKDEDDSLGLLTRELSKLTTISERKEQETAGTLFSSLNEPLDHRFRSEIKNLSSNCVRKVQQEWDILRENLPAGIHVCVYESRIDILRAAVIGAHGTPYHDGVFFFDFQFPSNYPENPPFVRFLSQGLSINPNLYTDGKTCLSILNTWQGNESERWDPSKSNILQVLVSLQSLVLNSRPFFNEAEYDELVGIDAEEKRSIRYNENVFLLNCKMMIRVMQKPPKEFEEVVIDHFKKRCRFILRACSSYRRGHVVGSLQEDASSSGDSTTVANSLGFMLALDDIVPFLEAAFVALGAEP